LRLARLQEAKNNLEAAMKNRTAIDIAVGVIMAQNRCSQEAATTILRKASNSRNIKLRDVAASVIASASRTANLRTHFDE
jgi:AmiR/NasT family two-component response regulator